MLSWRQNDAAQTLKEIEEEKVTLSFRNDLEFILNILISQTDPCQQVQGLGVFAGSILS